MSGGSRLGTLRLSLVIPLTVMVSTLLGAALALALSARLSRESAFEEAEAALMNGLGRYQHILDAATRRRDEAFVEEIIASIGGDRRVIGAALVADGRVQASSQFAEVGRAVGSLGWSQAASAVVEQARSGVGPVVRRDDTALRTWGAIALTRDPDTPVAPAVLVIGFDVGPQWRALLHDARLAIAFFALLMLATAAAATLAFQRAIVRRTRPVLEAAKTFARGDLSARSGVTTDDEIGTMARFFDSMAEQLAQRHRATAEAEQRNRVLFEQASDPMFLHDAAGAFVDANPAALALVGYPLDELRRLGLPGLIAPEELKERPIRFDMLRERGAMNVTRTIASKSGERIPVEVNANVLSDGRIFTVARDLRPRLEADRLRAQAAANERLAVLGNLAAGVGHEINNPLTWMLDNLSRAAAELPEGPARALVNEAKAGAERIASIVADLRLFSREGDDEARPVVLETVVKTALNLVGPSVRERLTVRLEASGAPAVLAAERRLCEVLVNLVQNAAHAMPEGRPAASNELVITAAAKGTQQVALSVRDNGRGIPAEVLPRLFEPYFTTRPNGAGSGLGLALSKELLGRMGATIDVTSTFGQGATFTITFAAARPASEQALAAPPAGSGRRVLVVDDEPLVARVAVRMLRGDEVKVAAGPAEALELCRTAEFDVVLCDLSMPDGGGARLYAELSTLRPALATRIVFVTGGASTDEAAGFLARTRLPVLHKPYGRAELEAAIDAVVGKKPPA
ncbi:MAG: response regulator [Myxococcaceae bacterium]|nr:response regulator [Myxococcaceae bacterium]